MRPADGTLPMLWNIHFQSSQFSDVFECGDEVFVELCCFMIFCMAAGVV